VNKCITPLGLAKYAILYGYKHNLFLKELIKEWNDDSDIITRCVKLQLNMNGQFMVVFSMLVNILTNDCKHPKKYRDRTNDGVLYCMSCNADLPKIKNKK